MERTWLGAFISAWNLLLEISFPNIGLWYEGEEPKEGDSLRTVACFPIVGAVLGYAAYCIAWILCRFESLSSSAAMSAIIIVLGLEIITLGRNFNTLIAFLEAKIQGLKELETIAYIEKEPYFCKTSLGLMFMMALFLLKIACVALLIYYERTTWIIITLAISYAVQAKISTSVDLRTSQPFIESDNRSEKLAWFFAAVISMVIGWSYSPAVVIVLILAYYLSDRFNKYCQKNFGGITAKIIGMAGSAAEILILLTGVVLIARD